jgi:hypothetical protein
MHVRTLLAAVPVAALAVALPTSASAATITPSQACYVNIPTGPAQPITFTLSGGTPNGRFQVFGVDGKASSVVGNFDGAGNATGAITGKFSVGGSISALQGRTVTLAVNEFTPNGTIETGRTNITVTNAAIDIARKPTNPFRKRTWRVSGLTPLFGGGPLYASYVNGKGKSNKVVKRVKLGTPNACGYLKVKRLLPPKRAYRTWTVFVHVGPSLDKGKSLSYNFRTFKRYY